MPIPTPVGTDIPMMQDLVSNADNLAGDEETQGPQVSGAGDGSSVKGKDAQAAPAAPAKGVVEEVK